ncbi:MAG: subclass B3 metallo-beta-lactamase [Bacteroidota bacterium]
MSGHLKNITVAFLLFIAASQSIAQTTVQEPKPWDENWSKPYQPFRIAGNLYYVGTYDLACYLITTIEGNILINTGLAASASQIKNNIETLGFKFSDIKILLTTQAHYDHMGAMAAIKESTGAKMMVDEKDAAVLKDGGSSDYALGGKGSTYQPVTPDRLLKNGDTISLGNMQLVMLHHPGHTKGSCSFLFTVSDEKKLYKVLIANMPTIVTDKKFEEVTSYRDIASDYAYTLTAMKNISFDIWLASHASQFNMHDKHKPGDTYYPAAFIDQAGYDQALAELQKDYEEKVKQ